MCCTALERPERRPTPTSTTLEPGRAAVACFTPLGMEKGICTRYEKPGWTPTRTRCSARHRERRLPLARAATSHNILGLPGFALAAEAEKPTSALHIDPNQSGFRASPPRSSQPSAAGSSSPSQRPLRTRRSGAWPAGRSPAPRLLTPGRLRGGASRREGASQVPGGGAENWRCRLSHWLERLPIFAELPNQVPRITAAVKPRCLSPQQASG